MAHTTLLTVICEAALEHKLVTDLEQLGAPGWTLSDVRGRGAAGGWTGSCADY
jgi:nitrogen regulatory protein PII